jgi:hypothetical protein
MRTREELGKHNKRLYDIYTMLLSKLMGYRILHAPNVKRKLKIMVVSLQNGKMVEASNGLRNAACQSVTGYIPARYVVFASTLI